MTAPRMTPDQIAAIEARAQAATEGPWEETWIDIPGFGGYQVSDFGNVRSFFKKGNHSTKRAQEARTLSLVDRRGYRTVSLPLNGKYSHRLVHRLVMLAFEGPCPESFEVAHLNGDASDNRYLNLAYVTHEENEAHKVLHGTNGAGERNAAATLQGWQVAEIKFLAAKSVPQGKIAALFDISHKLVSEVLSGRNWEYEPARTDVPALLAHVRDLETRLDKVKTVVPIQHGLDHDARFANGYNAAIAGIRAAITEERGEQA